MNACRALRKPVPCRVAQQRQRLLPAMALRWRGGTVPANPKRAAHAEPAVLMVSLLRAAFVGCRSNLGDVDLAGPLLRLTEEEDATVAWQAAAALANLTVDCSAIKVRCPASSARLHAAAVASAVRMAAAC